MTEKTDGPPEVEILAADYHRNGVSGDGFYVGIIRRQEEPDSRKLVVYFPRIGQCAIAVLDLDMAHDGNVHMFPDPETGSPGGNAWRGDHYIDAAEQVKSAVEAQWAAPREASPPGSGTEGLMADVLGGLPLDEHIRNGLAP